MFLVGQRFEVAVYGNSCTDVFEYRYTRYMSQ